MSNRRRPGVAPPPMGCLTRGRPLLEKGRFGQDHGAPEHAFHVDPDPVVLECHVARDPKRHAILPDFDPGPEVALRLAALDERSLVGASPGSDVRDLNMPLPVPLPEGVNRFPAEFEYKFSQCLSPLSERLSLVNYTPSAYSSHPFPRRISLISFGGEQIRVRPERSSRQGGSSGNSIIQA